MNFEENAKNLCTAYPKIPVQMWPFSNDGSDLRLFIFECQLTNTSPSWSEAIPCLPEIKNALNKRKLEHFAGRLCAQYAMLAAGGDVEPIYIKSDRSPEWPRNFIGSITHSIYDGIVHAAAIVGFPNHYSHLGLDWEELPSAEKVRELEDHILTSSEKKLIPTLSIDKVFLNTLIFSLKESFYKAVYPSIKKFINFSEVEIIELDFSKNEAKIKCKNPNFVTAFSDAVLSGYFTRLEANSVITLVAVKQKKSSA